MPDLSTRLDRASVRVLRILTSTCTVRRDPPGIDDDVLDEATGQLVPSAEDEPPVWSGPCAVSPANRVPDDAGAERLGPTLPAPEGHYVGRLPLTAPLLQVNDVLQVTASRDPGLVGRRFRVSRATPPDSYAVLRVIALEAL